jgi:hypothetical protein
MTTSPVSRLRRPGSSPKRAGNCRATVVQDWSSSDRIRVTDRLPPQHVPNHGRIDIDIGRSIVGLRRPPAAVSAVGRRMVAEVNALLHAHPAQTPKEACQQLHRRARLYGRRAFTREELAYLVACRGVARLDLVDAVRRLQTQPGPLVWQWVEGTATHGTSWDLFSAFDDD